MSHHLLRYLFLLLLCVAMGTPQAQAGKHRRAARADPVPKTYVISITVGTEDLQRAYMALQLASEALADGHPVKIFLHLNAVHLASASLPNADVLGTTPTVKELMRQVVDGGGQVLVCEHCMAFHGLTAEQLIDGVSTTADHSLYPHLGPDTVLVNF